MPELPEVEILRLGLLKYVKGLTIEGIEVRTPKIFEGSISGLVGGKIEDVRRFGKMLAIDLSNEKSLAVHVKMTGRLVYRGKKQPKGLVVDEDIAKLPNKHTHIIFSFKNGDLLYYNDVRKFGWVKVVNSREIEQLPFVQKLGPEPFRDLTQQGFGGILSKYSRPIKTLLMDQQRISGVGNIYANEALFCSRITPGRKSNAISSKRAQALYGCVLKVLRAGMKYGGSSTDSFRDVLGQRGKYQHHYFVYDREEKKCRREGCSGTIRKMKMGGRGTYYCPKCQR